MVRFTRDSITLDSRLLERAQRQPPSLQTLAFGKKFERAILPSFARLSSCLAEYFEKFGMFTIGNLSTRGRSSRTENPASGLDLLLFARFGDNDGIPHPAKAGRARVRLKRFVSSRSHGIDSALSWIRKIVNTRFGSRTTLPSWFHQPVDLSFQRSSIRTELERTTFRRSPPQKMGSLENRISAEL